MHPLPNLPLPGDNFRYLRWAGLSLIAVVISAIVAVQTGISVVDLSRENGVIEILSALFWLMAVLLSIGTVIRRPEAADRLMAVWLGCIALLAGLRELDLHHALGPDYLGAYGMRFRISWWLDGNVSLALKAGWLVVFAVLLAVLIYPPWKVRPPAWTLTRRGNAMMGFFVLAVLFCGLGGFIDDQLRGTTFFPKELRRFVEETSEMVGAMAFAGSAYLRWRDSYAAHLRSVGLPRGKGDL